ncbi:MAG: asparagine synthetase B, partial [Verrucomicrobia bacterium]|nr:asparagine synthetase B [Verrucomicrobiota bacterium]
MCGIAVTFARSADAPGVDRSALDRCRDRMAPRGPDGSGTWVSPDGRIGLAHRRLSILDLSEAGAQPMASADGSLHIVFNGEIY